MRRALNATCRTQCAEVYRPALTLNPCVANCRDLELTREVADVVVSCLQRHVRRPRVVEVASPAKIRPNTLFSFFATREGQQNYSYLLKQHTRVDGRAGDWHRGAADICTDILYNPSSPNRLRDRRM